MALPFEIVVISPPESGSPEGELVNDLFRAGLTRFYLRKGGASKGELSAYLHRIEPRFYDRVVVGSHFELVDDFGLGGAHLPTEARLHQETFRFWAARRAEEGKRLSTSVHSVSELEALGANFDFTFLSPIFGSLSKDLPRGAFQEAELKRAPTAGVNRVYALGGIDRDTVVQAKALGFKGCGVIGGVWGASDPVGAFKGLQEAVGL
jgi:thiamine-phosphate pyrophosphorylase